MGARGAEAQSLPPKPGEPWLGTPRRIRGRRSGASRPHELASPFPEPHGELLGHISTAGTLAAASPPGTKSQGTSRSAHVSVVPIKTQRPEDHGAAGSSPPSLVHAVPPHNAVRGYSVFSADKKG